jgi:hypothetical protein
MLVMLLSAATFVAGYRDSAQGRSDMRPLAETIVSTYPDADVINGDTRDERISTDFAIYLNRSTRRDANWRTIKATTRPTVVVLTQRPGDNEPTASAAWNFLGKVRRDDDVYYAYVLPPLR